MIRPAVGADLDVMAAAVIATTDQHIADAEARISPKVISGGWVVMVGGVTGPDRGRRQALNSPQNSICVYMSLAIDCATRIATQL
jgi:hypothetical protein